MFDSKGPVWLTQHVFLKSQQSRVQQRDDNIDDGVFQPVKAALANESVRTHFSLKLIKLESFSHIPTWRKVTFLDLLAGDW